MISYASGGASLLGIRFEQMSFSSRQCRNCTSRKDCRRKKKAFRVASANAIRTMITRAFSGRYESKRDSHGNADLIQGAGWMEAGMDGQAVINGPAIASAGCG